MIALIFPKAIYDFHHPIIDDHDHENEKVNNNDSRIIMYINPIILFTHEQLYAYSKDEANDVILLNENPIYISISINNTQSLYLSIISFNSIYEL